MIKNCLIVAYNKPEPLQILLNWAGVQFDRVFVHIDFSSQSVENKQVRKIVEKLVSKNSQKYFIKVQTENKGSCFGPIEAFKWFYSLNDHGFIFEEDCVPNKKFPAITEIERDRLVCFSNFDGRLQSNLFFRESSLFNSWGWSCPKYIVSEFLDDFNESTQCRLKRGPKFLKNYFYYLDKIHLGKARKTWWDFQFIAYLVNRDISILRPTINLVDNMGINHLGSHTHHYDPHRKKLNPKNKFLQWLMSYYVKDNILAGDYVNWLKFGLFKFIVFTVLK